MMIEWPKVERLSAAISATDGDDKRVMREELTDLVKGWRHNEPEVNWPANDRIAAVYEAVLECLNNG